MMVVRKRRVGERLPLPCTGPRDAKGVLISSSNSVAIHWAPRDVMGRPEGIAVPRGHLPDEWNASVSFAHNPFPVVEGP